MAELPHFGHRLKTLRLERGMSQAQLAGDGMSTGYLSRLESGERRATDRAITYLATQLGVDADTLTQPAGGSLSEALAIAASTPSNADMSPGILRAVDEDEQTDPAARWQALWLLDSVTDAGLEPGRLQELVELADAIGVPELRVRARVRRARRLRGRGAMDDAQTLAAQALDIAVLESLSTFDRMAALLVLISVEAESGSVDAATRHVRELEKWLPEAAPTQAAEALWTAAMVSARQGDFAAAKARLEDALALVAGQDDLSLWQRLRAAAIAAALQMTPPELDDARRWLAEVEPAVRLTGTPLQRDELLSLQAYLAFQEGRTADARRMCDELLHNENLGLSYRDRVRLLALDSQLKILEGDAETGIATLQQLGQQATESKNLALATQLWQSLATTLAKVRQV
ncbi:helix-turn-helix domain-containing protein [Winogradskya humida]|uniref:HTH cro/C1-type domain-containing protein n=1 Tax=Winogradskya humida TaxID=113566 RepID=A0ABQ4A0Z5_9ACTN|nr:helix-turn-helix transcriptional regulator [Actinoplanes humidus]GIE24531.1 hypothetical protein Ahu01nite_076330 [Actinoplanes humidus]